MQKALDARSRVGRASSTVGGLQQPRPVPRRESSLTSTSVSAGSSASPVTPTADMTHLFPVTPRSSLSPASTSTTTGVYRHRPHDDWNGGKQQHGSSKAPTTAPKKKAKEPPRVPRNQPSINAAFSKQSSVKTNGIHPPTKRKRAKEQDDDDDDDHKGRRYADDQAKDDDEEPEENHSEWQVPDDGDEGEDEDEDEDDPVVVEERELHDDPVALARFGGVRPPLVTDTLDALGDGEDPLSDFDDGEEAALDLLFEQSAVTPDAKRKSGRQLASLRRQLGGKADCIRETLHEAGDDAKKQRENVLVLAAEFTVEQAVIMQESVMQYEQHLTMIVEQAEEGTLPPEKIPAGIYPSTNWTFARLRTEVLENKKPLPTIATHLWEKSIQQVQKMAGEKEAEVTAAGLDPLYSTYVPTSLSWIERNVFNIVVAHKAVNWISRVQPYDEYGRVRKVTTFMDVLEYSFLYFHPGPQVPTKEAAVADDGKGDELVPGIVQDRSSVSSSSSSSSSSSAATTTLPAVAVATAYHPIQPFFRIRVTVPSIDVASPEPVPLDRCSVVIFPLREDIRLAEKLTDDFLSVRPSERVIRNYLSFGQSDTKTDRYAPACLAVWYILAHSNVIPWIAPMIKPSTTAAVVSPASSSSSSSSSLAHSLIS